MILRDPSRGRGRDAGGAGQGLARGCALRDPERFEAWLRRLLVNACYDEARRAGRPRRGPLDRRPEPAGDDPAPSFADQERVDRALRRSRWISGRSSSCITSWA
jgi:DNA-directed RNA polymerase specialized sigma24 family protein